MAENLATRGETNWEVPAITPSPEKSQTLTLSTKDKYVDKDIKVTVEKIKAGAASADAASASAASDDVALSASEISGGYKITASGSGNSKVTSAGYLNPGSLPIASTTKDYWVAKATPTSTNSTVSATTSTDIASTVVASTYTTSTTKPASGYYIGVSADASATPATASVSAGYAKEKVSATGTQSSKSAKSYVSLNASSLSATEITPGSEQTVTIGAGYYPSARTVKVKAANAGAKAVFTKSGLQRNADGVGESLGLITNTAGFTDATTASNPLSAGATLTNHALASRTYRDLSKPEEDALDLAPILISGDYLYVNKGYVGEDYKISLARLVPDNIGDVAIGAGTAALRKGNTLLDKDGVAVTGTMDNATVKSGTVSISANGAIAYNENGKFSIPITAQADAPTVVDSHVGYISNTEGTRQASEKASATRELNKIIGSINFANTDKVTPTITRQNVPTGVTNAASGNATTTAPTSGVYVAVKTGEVTRSASASVAISQAGYGDSVHHGITAGSVTVGAAASDSTYIPIATTSRTAGAGSVSGSATGVTFGAAVTTKPTSGAYVTMTGSGKVSTGDGWVAAGTTTSNSATSYYPVTVTDAQAPALVGTGVAAVNSGSITVTGSTIKKNNTSGKYEIAMSGSASIGGKIATKGFVKVGDTVTPATVSASGTAVINAGAVSCAIKSSSTLGITAPSVIANSYDGTTGTVKLSTSASGQIAHTITKTAGYIEAGTIEGTPSTVSTGNVTFGLAAYTGSYTLA